MNPALIRSKMRAMSKERAKAWRAAREADRWSGFITTAITWSLGILICSIAIIFIIAFLPSQLVKDSPLANFIAWAMLYIFIGATLVFFGLMIWAWWRIERGVGNLSRNVVYARVEKPYEREFSQCESSDLLPYEDDFRFYGRLSATPAALVAGTTIVPRILVWFGHPLKWDVIRPWLFAHPKFISVVEVAVVVVVGGTYLLARRGYLFWRDARVIKRATADSASFGADYRLATALRSKRPPAD